MYVAQLSRGAQVLLRKELMSAGVSNHFDLDTALNSRLLDLTEVIGSDTLSRISFISNLEFSLQRRGFHGSPDKMYSNGMYSLRLDMKKGSWSLLGTGGGVIEDGSLKNLPTLFAVIDHYRML